MYIVKSGNGYILDERTLLMVSELDKAKRLDIHTANKTAVKLNERGLCSEVVYAV